MKRVLPDIAIVLLLLCPALPCALAQSGARVGGEVRDLHGAPQMGALIELLGPDAAVVAHTFTDEHGRYVLEAVAPGRYELRASAAFLFPAMRPNLRLAAGGHAIANMTMTALFEVGAWFPVEKRGPEEPADDWRWTLRSSANRPLLRLASDPENQISSSAERVRGTSAQGRFAILAGDERFGQGGTHQVFSADKGEGGGAAEVLRANVGDPGWQGAAPSIAVNAGVERKTVLGGDTRVVAGIASHPEIASAGVNGLQVLTLATSEHMVLGDAVMIDAGTLVSAEHLLASRVNSAPYLRVMATPEPGLAVLYRFATDRVFQSPEDLDRVETTPTVLSDAHGRPVDLQGVHQELAMSHMDERDTETVMVYEDRMPVSAVQGGGTLTAASLQGLPVMTDAITGMFRVAMEGYTARGVSASWTHRLTPAVAACVQGDLGSALALNGQTVVLSTLQDAVHPRTAVALSAKVNGRLARTQTSYRVQYRWQPKGTLDAVNGYNNPADEAYLGLSLRQRLWAGTRLQGLEAVLEATNLLDEGYEPMLGPDGQTLFLAQTPRSLQAGLSFSF